MNGRNVMVATIAFGSRCRTMILALETPSARAAVDIFEIAAAQGIRRAPDRPADTQGKQQQNAEQHEEARHQHRRQDQQQIQRRDRGPDSRSSAETGQIDPSAEIALDAAGRDADDRRHNRQAQAEQDRDPEAVDQPRHHVATADRRSRASCTRGHDSILTKPFLATTAAHSCLGQQPGRFRRRTASADRSPVGAVGVTDRRPDHRRRSLVGDQASCK